MSQHLSLFVANCPPLKKFYVFLKILTKIFFKRIDNNHINFTKLVILLKSTLGSIGSVELVVNAKTPGKLAV
jgi:hypothetical protein